MGEEWALIIRVWDMAFYLLAVVISDEDIVHDAVVTAAKEGIFPYVQDQLGWYRKTSVGEQRWVRWPIDPGAAEQPNIISL